MREFASKLKGLSSVAIICHIRPDGDSIGSGLALSLGLKKLGICTEVFCDDAMPDKFSFLKGINEVKNEFLSTTFDGVVAVDCADISRLGNMATIFLNAKNTFNIDHHHLSNTFFATYNVVIEKSANCENIFYLLKELNVEIDKDIADCLMAGIITDSGRFAYSSVTSDTFKVASSLMEKGASLTSINDMVMRKQSIERAKLYAHVISKVRFYEDNRIAIMYVLREDFEKFNAKEDATDGFVEFVNSIFGVDVSLCIMQNKGNTFKISFRSSTVDVNEIASLFGGGGHKCASGCMLNGSLESVIDKLLYPIKQRLN